MEVMKQIGVIKLINSDLRGSEYWAVTSFGPEEYADRLFTLRGPPDSRVETL